MSMSLLPATQAWTAGSPIWVAALPENSLWSRKLDWSLNFCLTKGLSHRSQPRAIALENLLKTIAWKIPAEMEMNQDPLLIGAAQRLPCDWVLLLKNFSTEKKKLAMGLKTLSTVWQQLGQPKLRLFAPTHFEQKDLLESWSKSDLPSDFELILE